MSFVSLAFVAFFVTVLIALNLSRSRTQRQVVLLLASVYFYAYWKALYLFVLALPAIVDYWCAIAIAKAKNRNHRKVWLIASLTTNIGLLGYFKYANFFLENVQEAFGTQLPHLHIILPIGISFFTFKTMSYTIDVYRGEIDPCRSLWRYSMFIAFFPELVAGPIVRASIFLPQMTKSLKPSAARTWVGLQLMLLGFSKKLLVADNLALFVDAIFREPNAYSPATVTAAVVAYSLQIYCDFSGYSDIAIGAAKIIGFDLPENFNMPYLSTSVVEFWRRWHITLSDWLRDYLYFSLPGFRKGELQRYRNLLITMLLAGLWHGASWTFVAWGFLHGVGLTVNHFIKSKRRGVRKSKLAKFAAWFGTYVFICLTWVIFRASNFSQAWMVYRKVFWLDNTGIHWTYAPLIWATAAVVICHIIGVHANKAVGQKLRIAFSNRVKAPIFGNVFYAIRLSPISGLYTLLPLGGFTGAAMLTSWSLCIFLFANVHTNPFIYFQF